MPSTKRLLSHWLEQENHGFCMLLHASVQLHAEDERNEPQENHWLAYKLSTALLNSNSKYSIISKQQRHTTRRSSPVRSAKFRCCDSAEATIAPSTFRSVTSSRKDYGFSLAPLSMAWKICRGSPWLTIRIAELQGTKHTSQLQYHRWKYE